MAKRGPKGKYDPAIHPNLIRWMCRSGLTNEQIAAEIGIAESTLYKWQDDYSEISEALKNSREMVDHLVEDSLLKRAMGFRYTETRKVRKETERGFEDSETTIETEVAPDTTAAIFWLKNRQPKEWRDKRVEELEAGEGTKIEVTFVKPGEGQ